MEWRRVFRGYQFHYFHDRPHVGVNFHETKGFVDLECTDEIPEPKSYEVKIVREEAIFKASKVAPFVEKSPYYLRARVPGFVSCTVKEVALKIVVPNWLLDPKQAIWISDAPPTETRLCWVVRFLTRPGSQELADKQLIAPDIYIYIDALTGETIGADFS